MKGSKNEYLLFSCLVSENKILIIKRYCSLSNLLKQIIPFPEMFDTYTFITLSKLTILCTKYVCKNQIENKQHCNDDAVQMFSRNLRRVEIKIEAVIVIDVL